MPNSRSLPSARAIRCGTAGFEASPIFPSASAAADWTVGLPRRSRVRHGRSRSGPEIAQGANRRRLGRRIGVSHQLDQSGHADFSHRAERDQARRGGLRTCGAGSFSAASSLGIVASRSVRIVARVRSAAARTSGSGSAAAWNRLHRGGDWIGMSPSARTAAARTEARGNSARRPVPASPRTPCRGRRGRSSPGGRLCPRARKVPGGLGAAPPLPLERELL